MSQWMLTCSTCGRDFPHSPIRENLTFIKFVLLHKPEFPSEGLALDCPHCGESGTYQPTIYCIAPHAYDSFSINVGITSFTKSSWLFDASADAAA